MSKSIAVFLLAALAIFVLPSGRVWAGFIAPTGLAPGSQYQIAFVTQHGITGTSSSISTYNTFVANEAALDLSLPAGLTWDAIVSTASTNANANAPSSGSIPVYDTQGNLITSPGNSLYGSLSNPLLMGVVFDQNGNLVSTGFETITLSGQPVTAPLVWTGSKDDGTVLSGSGLGASNPNVALVGQTGTGLSFLSDGTIFVLNTFGASPHITTSTSFPIYALSSPVTVVPEPSTFVFVGSAIVLIGGRRLLRRQRGA